jgi:gamma-glutamylcyclotransferase (GGCT)/AIG2-like uncharacterized protein YtfP
MGATRVTLIIRPGGRGSPSIHNAPSATTFLLVYGTLKHGQNHDYYLACQEFIGPAQTTPKYKLFDTGSHPCMVETSEGDRAINGEIYAVDADALGRQDFHEGCPRFSSARPSRCPDITKFKATAIEGRFGYSRRWTANGRRETARGCLSW